MSCAIDVSAIFQVHPQSFPTSNALLPSRQTGHKKVVPRGLHQVSLQLPIKSTRERAKLRYWSGPSRAKIVHEQPHAGEPARFGMTRQPRVQAKGQHHELSANVERRKTRPTKRQYRSKRRE